MPHHPTQRRNLAASDPKTSMDPTNKKHPISSTTTTTTTTTIHPITKHYPKFNSNHKARTSLKTTDPPPPPPPRVDTHLQAKALAASTIAASNTSLTNSNRRHGTRINVSETEEESKVRAKARSEKGREKKEAHERRSDVMNRACVSLAVSGKRRSFCDSHVELADFFSCTGVKVVSVDMPPFMQIHAVDFARKAYDSLEKFTSKTLASTLKKEFDGVYGPAWHCILGTSFGSFVTHSVGGFLYFSMDQKLYVLLFKTTVQRAD